MELRRRHAAYARINRVSDASDLARGVYDQRHCINSSCFRKNEGVDLLSI
jgi:hypothetical protein